MLALDDEEGMRALMLGSQQQADQALDEARARAQHILAQAEQYARVLMDEAVAATRHTREGACRAAEADLRRLEAARDRLRLQALAVERDVLAAPLPSARPSWPSCLHAVEQSFPAASV
jgi:F0F1-type ATP synthase membrane subunit b/b'